MSETVFLNSLRSDERTLFKNLKKQLEKSAGEIRKEEATLGLSLINSRRMFDDVKKNIASSFGYGREGPTDRTKFSKNQVQTFLPTI